MSARGTEGRSLWRREEVQDEKGVSLSFELEDNSLKLCCHKLVPDADGQPLALLVVGDRT